MKDQKKPTTPSRTANLIEGVETEVKESANTSHIRPYKLKASPQRYIETGLFLPDFCDTHMTKYRAVMYEYRK